MDFARLFPEGNFWKGNVEMKKPSLKFQGPRIEVLPSLKKRMLLAITLVAVTFSLFPLFFSGGYIIRFFIKLFMWVALAESWNTITGYTKRVDFGHIVFTGTSAYITSILAISVGIQWGLAAIAGIIVAVLLALFVGLPTLRLHGAYFAIATWCVAEAFKWLFYLLPKNISGGPDGMNIPPIVTPNILYYLTFIFAVGAVLLNFIIEKSELGYSLRAIAESETAAETMGISVLKPKLTAFILSAIPAAFVGALYPIWVSYLFPMDVFDSLKTDTMVVMVLLGGMGSYLGSLVGSIFFTIIFEVLWTYFTNVLYLIFLGIVILLTILFLPKGFLGTKKVVAIFKRYKVEEAP